MVALHSQQPWRQLQQLCQHFDLGLRGWRDVCGSAAGAVRCATPAAQHRASMQPQHWARCMQLHLHCARCMQQGSCVLPGRRRALNSFSLPSASKCSV
jgi:hypothetical protein